MAELLDKLNPEQIKAVQATEGPVLILAGAGSGKTKTLTSRVAYLVQTKKATPSEILAVTFTNKAAGEMKQRIMHLLRLKSDKAFHISTFHSLCSRILRKELQQGSLLTNPPEDSSGEYTPSPPNLPSGRGGIRSNFTILDTNDQVTAIKQVMRELNIDLQQYAPAAILNFISSAKNELIMPDNYSEMAYGHFQKIVAKVYPRYQEILHANNSLDFDDLLMLTVKLFQTHKDVLKKYQDKFKYVLVDEYQDTNTSQYQLIKLLVAKHKNIFVVGDDWQCLPPTTKILTNKGSRSIQKISNKERVVCASGRSDHNLFDVTTVGKRKYKGQMLTIKTEKGHQITTTPNHIFFARLSETSKKSFVYLMYSPHKGYRIGIAKGIRNSGKKLDCGLRVRCNQERADKMWILKVCDSRPEAKYFEDYFSYKYGVPMTVFWNMPGRSMQYQQKYIDDLYRNIDTKKRASLLMKDLLLDEKYPHFLPSGTTPKHRDPRKIINLTMFGDARKTIQSPWCATRFSFQSSNNKLKDKLDRYGLQTRKSKKATWRIEKSNRDSQQFNSLVRAVQTLAPEVIINESAFITNNKFQFQPASHLRPDMTVPIWSNNKIVEDKIKSIKTEDYQGEVFDLNIEKVHNFIADGFVVHNSIYSWRGANYRNILNFHKDYPKAKIIKLEENYRSTQNILSGAAAVIANNQNRSQKTLWTKNGEGEKIVVKQVFNEQQEGEWVIHEILRQRSLDPRAEFNDFVVLYRTNAQSRALEEALLKANLPYRIIGGTRFYDRKEIKDVLAFLRVIANPQDDISLKRIINLPPRGVGEKTWADLAQHATAQNLPISEILLDAPVGTKAKIEIGKLGGIIANARNSKTNLSKLFDTIIDKTGYLKWLDDKTIEGETRIENVKELKSVMEKYDILDAEIALPTFLEEVSLVQDIDRYDDSEKAINLMTLHSAKGLEFDYVFMVGMEENLFPHSRSTLDHEELEEERRLCYVGMTRAKKQLYLAYTAQRLLYGSSTPSLPSRFIEDIPEELIAQTEEDNKKPDLPEIKAKVGDWVEHKHFGVGKVLAIDQVEVVIAFSQFGIKRLARSLAPLKKLAITDD
ncbi:MAG: ATP-dependent DNA helicase PcrA [candidate division Kazan bacterium GW2011_GWA1_44_22]|uniref:DNA 3'-5' helicase n=2 Tax=Bacteria division Kazan-3B-28 TaxID=1798534 RepID=A0A0G1I0R1_UNCK3|nr:MAG: ATP-dependent DNA helicase PcrA [candidate division Kazan bacterium GW2011_GWA1_44_22]